MKTRRQPRRASRDGKECFFVIPDINGEADMLEKLLTMIDSNEHYPLAKGDSVVFLGNYMGPETKRCLDIIREFKTTVGCDVVCLTGPNDYKFMKARDNFFRTEVGVEVANSYRVDYPHNPNSYRQNSVDVETMMDDRNWLATLHSFCITEHLFFCYGGVNPELSLDKQSVGAMMFNCVNAKVSPLFKEHVEEFERIIIHSGYVTQAKPFIKKAKTGRLNRINVNTDSKVTGYLSCSVLDGETGTLLTTISAYDEDRYSAWLRSVGRDEEAKELKSA